MTVEVKETEHIIAGKPAKVVLVHVDNKEITISGKNVKTATIESDWHEDIDDPAILINALKSCNVKADVLTFMQCIPQSKPKYNYYMEWDNLAAIPITSYTHWFEKQIRKQERTKTRKAIKYGVEIRLTEFDDDFIKGMTDIFNETPVRQGKRNWHYGKDFETIKKQFTRNSEKCDFIGAYYGSELIGFVWLLYAGNFVRTVQITGKIAHRDKLPTNALLAKAVEICAEKQIPYLVYGSFDYDGTGSNTLTDFKHYNGFEKIILPRYFVPLTFKGKLYIALNLHHGLAGMLPKRVVVFLKNLRKKWYARKNSKTPKPPESEKDA